MENLLARADREPIIAAAYGARTAALDLVAVEPDAAPRDYVLDGDSTSFRNPAIKRGCPHRRPLTSRASRQRKPWRRSSALSSQRNPRTPAAPGLPSIRSSKTERSLSSASARSGELMLAGRT